MRRVIHSAVMMSTSRDGVFQNVLCRKIDAVQIKSQGNEDNVMVENDRLRIVTQGL